MSQPNEQGTAHHNHNVEMAAFDRLPKLIRTVLNDAMRNFSSVQILDELRYYSSAAELANFIKRTDETMARGHRAAMMVPKLPALPPPPKVEASPKQSREKRTSVRKRRAKTAENKKAKRKTARKRL